MMLLGILSDTHIHQLEDGFALAELLLDGPFAGVDAVLHAGDHVHDELDSCFAPLPFYSVCGNMDQPSAQRPLKRILELAGKRIGMVHGWGAPAGIEQRVFDSFAADAVDVIVYGHSHRPCCTVHEGVLLLNPGSALDRRSAPQHTVARLQLGDQIHAEIIPLD